MATVQILMAVYNGEPYLAEQIDSIIAQSYTDWELLISDDSSSDKSLQIIQEYCAQDPRIRLVLEDEHFGSAKSHFLALFKIANAPYVMTSDQDDMWDSDKIEITLAAMTKTEDRDKSRPLLVCTDLRVVDSDLNVIHGSMLEYSNMDADKVSFGYFLASCLVTGCTMMINDPLLNLMQKDCDEKNIIMHDWWASLVASAFGEVVYIKKQTISYRQHSDNSVGAVGFSLLGALQTLKDRSKVSENTILQALELLRVFGDVLPNNTIEQAEALIEIPQAGPMSRIIKLTKADVWRKGILRNTATLISFLIIPRTKKAR